MPLRTSYLALAVSVVLAGCADSVAPPTASAPGDPELAKSSNVTTVTRSDVTFTIPGGTCGPTTTITGTGVLTLLFRATENAQGTHIGTTIHGHGTATDATGARWIWTDADLNNELFPSGNTSSHAFSQTVRENFNVIGPNGQKVMVKGTFHVTRVNGTTVVEFETGNHEDAEVCESGFGLTPLP